MKKLPVIVFCLGLLFGSTAGLAETLQIPAKKSLVSVTIPDGWTMEAIEKGYNCESKDGEVTILFEITNAKGIDKLLDETIEWFKEQKLTINEASKKESDFRAEGMDWSKITWKASNPEWGKADIAFVFGDLGRGKIIVVTYWITTKGARKHAAEIDKVFESFRRLNN